MDKYDLYRDIATRTGGDIYVGVVGPVRTGKSTVVKQFMEKLVVDGIKDADARARAIDEIPQSADGKTIMTTQPRFVPAEAARVNFRDNLAVNMRLIDCVGYLVAGALGGEEDGRDRMVSTPWSEEDMPFAEAAEIGTDKVIREHSTVAVAVLTDGSFTGIPREQYIPAEEKVIAELKRTGKPFAVLLNTADPAAESARALAAELAAKYDAPVTVAHAPSMTESDISAVMEDILLEFGVRRIDLKLPRWVQALPADDEVVREMLSAVRDMGEKVSKMKDYEGIDAFFEGREFWQLPSGVELEAGEGRIEVTVRPKEDVFYRVASRESGLDITDDFSLLANIRTMAAAKSRTERLAAALEQAEATGYGVVHPTVEEMTLGEPEIISNKTGAAVRRAPQRERAFVAHHARGCQDRGQSHRRQRTAEFGAAREPASRLRGRQTGDMADQHIRAQPLRSRRRRDKEQTRPRARRRREQTQAHARQDSQRRKGRRHLHTSLSRLRRSLRQFAEKPVHEPVSLVERAFHAH